MPQVAATETMHMSQSEKIAHLEQAWDSLSAQQMAAAERGDVETVEKLMPRLQMLGAAIGSQLVEF